MHKNWALAGVVLVGTAVSDAAMAAPHGARLTYSDDPTTTIAISWTSTSATDVEVIFGTTPSDLSSSIAAQQTFAQPDPLSNSFTAKLSGLTPNTTYYYRVGSAGNYHPPGGSDPFQFTTLGGDPCQPFSFVLIGDNRADTDNVGPSPKWPKILAETQAYAPQFYVNTGDMVKNGERAVEWANFVDDSEAGWGFVPSILTIGNHDDMDDNGPGALYSQLFELPHNSQNDWENYYSIDVGPIHFVSLDSNLSGTEFTEMLAWLDADLAATDKPWRAVFFHHAIYSRGNHYTGEEDDGTLNANLIPIFDAHDVDFVFNGHSHNYERYAPTTGVDPEFGGSGRAYPAGNGAANAPGATVPDGATGTTYMVSGGAGALTTEIGGFECIDAGCTKCGLPEFLWECEPAVLDRDKDGMAIYDGKHNFAVFSVNGPRIDVEVWTTEEGNTGSPEKIDTFTVMSSDLGEGCGVDAPDAGAPGTGGSDGGGAGDDGPGAGKDSGGCGCRAASRGGASSLILVVLALAMAVRRNRISG